MRARVPPTPDAVPPSQDPNPVSPGRFGVSRRALIAGSLASAFVGTRVAALLDKKPEPEPEEVRVPPIDHLPDGTPVYRRTADILNFGSFAPVPGEKGTSFSRLKEILKARLKGEGKITYYDFKGNRIASVGATKDFPREGTDMEEPKNSWHNAQRREHHTREGVVLPDGDGYTGYPFVAVAGSPHKKLVEAHLNEAPIGPDYFEGKATPLIDALRTICNEYKDSEGQCVPFEVMLGLGAAESSFRPEIQSDSTPPARGIYQFLDYVAETKALPLLPEKTSYRKTRIVRNNPKNRFLQAELFCVHYLDLKEQLSLKLDQLSTRMKNLDPGFSGDLRPFATLTAYNGGRELTEACIDRFVALSDEDLKKRLGEGPYSEAEDVWQAVLAYNFGQKFQVPIDEKGTLGERTVGPEVYHYPARVLAWADLLK